MWEDASHGFLKLNSPCEVRGLVFVTQHLPFIGIFQFFIAATRNRMENPAGGQYKWQSQDMVTHALKLVSAYQDGQTSCYNQLLLEQVGKPIVLWLCIIYWHSAAQNTPPSLLIFSFRLSYWPDCSSPAIEEGVLGYHLWTMSFRSLAYNSLPWTSLRKLYSSS